MKFEEKMEELEKNVAALEQGDIDLDDALKKYTEAMKLAKECEEELEKAREQITKVIGENGEETELE